MIPKAGQPAAGERVSVPPARDVASDYRRLAAALASKARRLGSRDPESAAQEALRRSLENPKSQAAVEYYFAETLCADAPDWPLDQLLAWLHGVLRYVVREEQSRIAFHREISAIPGTEPEDASPDALEGLIDHETRAIADDCLARLDREYRDVLKLRLAGMKYDEIARRLGLNENTVATWVSRGVRELGRRIRQRMGGTHE